MKYSVIYICTFLLAFIFNPSSHSQPTERIIIDNFSQPDQISPILDYYGSGDANNDEIVDMTDYNLMQSGTSNDRTDIDGDGNPSTASDLSILNNYLSGSISYLPSHWNKLNSSEKINWFEKMVVIDKTDTLTITDEHRCAKYALAFTLNFHGFKDLNGINPEDVPRIYNKNGRFNISVYSVLTNLNVSPYHVINGVLIGNNPKNFNDWYFVEPQTDERVFPGDPNMLVNNPVKIDYIHEINPSDGAVSGWPMIQFNLDSSGNPSLPDEIYGDGPNPNPSVVLSNPNTDTNPPNISITSPENQTYNTSNISIEASITENETFLDEVYYKMDNGSNQYIPCVDDEIPIWPVNEVSINTNLSLADGEHTLFIYGSDIAKPEENSSTETITFIIDITPPTTSDNTPIDWQNTNFEVELYPTDALSGVASTKYCISSTNDCGPSINYSSPILITEEGENYLRYYSIDNAGNSQEIVSKILRLDKTHPSVSDNAPSSWQNSDFEITITSHDELSGIKSTKYCISSSSECNPTTEYSSPISVVEEGEKYLRYFTEDNAGNTSDIVTKTLQLDKTVPEIYIIYPENLEYAESVDSMVFTLKDANLQETVDYVINGESYSTNSADTVSVNTASVEGANTYSITVYDKAGNSAYAEVNFNFIPTAVEENTSESLKLYPNPVADILRFEGIERATIKLYDITGRQLEQKVIEGNTINLSKYSSGIYIIEIVDHTGKVFRNKFAKK